MFLALLMGAVTPVILCRLALVTQPPKMGITIDKRDDRGQNKADYCLALFH
jgi:hypothetical protein